VDCQHIVLPVAIEIPPHGPPGTSEGTPSYDGGSQRIRYNHPGTVDSEGRRLPFAHHDASQEMEPTSRENRIVELRPFRSVRELSRISGIAAGRLADMEREGKLRTVIRPSVPDWPTPHRVHRPASDGLSNTVPATSSTKFYLGYHTTSSCSH